MFDSQNKEIVNWYPGHMKKSIDIIKDKLNTIDFYIEVLDARAIVCSSNSELNSIFNNKPKVTIALKSDLSAVEQDDSNILFGSIYDKKFRLKIINRIKLVCKSKIDSLRKKGLVNIQLCGMVVGLPNIGKSSLINFLANKNLLISQNQPGITKRVSHIKIDNDLVLFDTPGIFFKKVDKFEIGAILTLIKSVNFEIVNKYEILEYGYNYIIKYYSEEIYKYFGFNSPLNFNDFLNYICDKKRFKLQNNENDFERCFSYLYSEFSDSKICNINYEKDL
ncbi:ribosome biogenesis GTPase YlqF [Malacoplasma muris]|uniref:ribosome biogenesis GTPase YlqF n=1 Tax=Malacoplasma muris TaxID=2119 RepID=UPI00398F3438